MLRVAHLGTKGLPAKGGTERVVDAAGKRHAANHEVTVYGSRLECSTGVYCGMRIEALPASPGERRGPVLLDLAAAAHCLVRRRFDVVYPHGSESSFTLPALQQFIQSLLTSRRRRHRTRAKDVRRQVRERSRSCWMTGNAVPAMRRYPLRAVHWVARAEWAVSCGRQPSWS